MKWTLIDIAVPADHNKSLPELKRNRLKSTIVAYYYDFRGSMNASDFKIRRIHGASKVVIIPIVIGALEAYRKGAKTWFRKLEGPDLLESVRLLAFLGTAYLLWKVLCL